MRSFRFLLSRRWGLFALTVVLVAWATWWLGQWQFNRLHERKHDNHVIETNEHRIPAPVEDVLTVGGKVDEDQQWRLVTVTGTYDAEHTITWRYRSDDRGADGIDVVVPLITDDGTAVIVDRGFLENPDNGKARPPAPPAGRVTVTGYVREDGTGSSTRVDDLSTRALSSRTVGPAIGRSVYAGWVALHTENGAPARSLDPIDLPDLGNGPHFFYGLQWWFFGVLAVFGFLYLLWDEWHGGKERRPAAQPAASANENVNTARQARASARAAKASRKQAVRQAYQAAYEKERAGRD
ncbi:Cytochrome oxidase assembly protein ShyY1 [Nocardioides terrae]|uniref:SURF1-like protein n=1 Tax=Nocardioides terrae TaxID=574651 RepID=A0A1I1JWE3_9ACTN|nr:SURF1 family protein [Nocardioides terrae]SFC50798.1 Cytochrome oxidase assembly protein ShyY1 [Nocardioides terrae]